MLPIFANTMELLKESVPQLMTVIHIAPNEHVENFIAGAVHRWPVPVVLIPGRTTQLRYDAFSVRPAVPLDFHLHNSSFQFIMSKLVAALENLFNTSDVCSWQLSIVE